MRNDALGLFWQDTPVVRATKPPPPKRTPPERTWERPGYLPGLEEALAFNVPLLSDQELSDLQLKGLLTGKRPKFVYDIECYPNYFLIAFKSEELGKVVYFEMFVQDGVTVTTFDPAKLRWITENFCHISFNGINYDAAIAALALGGATCPQMWEATCKIIVEQMRPSDVLRAMRVKKLQFDHIDLIEVAPLRASLKIYGGRLHTKRMQDLPFIPGTMLTANQVAIVRWYCLNDLANTSDLYLSLAEQLDLRTAMSYEYGVDLRSKSDAQIAEAVIGDGVENLNGMRPQKPTIPVGTAYRYKMPAYLQYTSPLMKWVKQTVENSWFVVDDSGSIAMPGELKTMKITIGNSVYQMGIGGLHSTEQSVVHVADDDHIISDHDVESYYPRIILNQGLYPQHLGKNFLRVYETIVNRRVAAKRAGDKVTADSLKITINGSFGKLGSKYSILYAPDLLIQTTITGQLSLLLLIERFELCGIPVVSANTDGIVIRCPKSKIELRDYIIKCWENDCGFITEETRYSALYSRDVNNYVAVYVEPLVDKKTGKKTYAKTKGAFAKTGLQKNPTNYICVEAVINLLAQRTPVYKTIQECTDIRKFVSVRTVTGGAVKAYDHEPPPAHGSKEELIRLAGFTEVADGMWNYGEGEFSVGTTEQAYTQAYKLLSTPKNIQYLGKSIRWYYAQGVEGEIVYAKNGNKVPKSDGAKPLMDLPDEFPSDVNYDWYIKEAETLLGTLGYAG